MNPPPVPLPAPDQPDPIPPAQAPLVLRAEGLCYEYPGGIPALAGLDLTIRRGERLALLGANGCGKTTLLLHLNGTLRPQSGRVWLEGAPVSYGQRDLTTWRNRVGLVLQEPDDQLFAATVYQDVSFGPLNQGLTAAAVHERVRQSLATLDIGALAERPTHALSFGQQKRVAIAGVLAMVPAVLILDEPTAGLDPDGVARLLGTFACLHEAGTTLVLSTHDVDLAWAWADEVAILAAGRVARQGPTAAVLADEALLAAARLRPPVLLTLARALGLAEPLPRGAAELVTRLGG